ncbi:hypothetical protein [Lutibacter sp.]|uniref:hypothetical protein n=1 Tax=Lutibacter sp. TaxID=1925666 RepID=UPI003566E600
MKTFKYFLSILLFVTAVISCNEDELGSLDFVSTAVAPTNLTVLLDVTPDNTGLVTITPNSEGAVSYTITLGDDTAEAVTIKQGENIQHVYAEGDYVMKVVAIGITGLKTELVKPFAVSFDPPEFVVFPVPVNDKATSKQVNVKVLAEEVKNAISFDVYFGEVADETPVTKTVGDEASHVYTEPGLYTIKIVLKGAAIETVEYIIEDFEVTEILQPLTAALTPSRLEANVVSIFSDAYTNVAVSEWNPGWGQSTVLSSFDVDGDNILKYDYLNYTGIVTSYDNPTDLSAMEYVHFDYWTNEGTQVAFKIVNTSQPDGDPLKESEVVTLTTEFGKWVSVDIALTDFTTDMSGVTQFVISSTGETVFMDNIYFWKEPSEVVSALLYDDFEGNGNIDTWFGDDCGMDNIFTNQFSDINNNSATVLKYTDAGGTYANVRFDAPSKFDLASDSKFSLKIYVPTSSVSGTQPKQISLKLQDGTASEPWVLQTEIIKTIVFDQWQTVTFDFATDVTAGQPDPLNRTDFDRVVLQVNGEGNGDTVTAYIDDFNYGIDTGSGGGGTSPIEGTWKLAPEEKALLVGSTAGDIWWFNSIEDLTTRACIFDDTYVFNADGSFNNVLGSDTWLEAWQGTADACGTPVAPHDGSASATYEYNTAAGTVTINGIGAYLGISKVINDAELTNPANAPASITYNVTLSDNDNTMNLEILVGGGNVWYFKLVRDGVITPPPPSNGTQIDFPVDFESSTVDYTLTDFGGNASSVIVDPNDANNMLAKVIKTNTAATWAGTTIGTDAGFATNIPITLINSKMSVRVWSPEAGTPIRLKIEDSNDVTHTCETETNTTVVGWETIEFDFANQAPGTELLSVGLSFGWVYNKASIFFNFGTDGATAGEKTYYFDDVLFIQ